MQCMYVTKVDESPLIGKSIKGLFLVLFASTQPSNIYSDILIKSLILINEVGLILMGGIYDEVV